MRGLRNKLKKGECQKNKGEMGHQLQLFTRCRRVAKSPCCCSCCSCAFIVLVQVVIVVSSVDVVVVVVIVIC